MIDDHDNDCRPMTDAKPRVEARPCTASVHMYSAVPVPVPCVLLYLYLFSPVAAPSAKQPVHGMSLVAAARSRLPGAAAPSGTITAIAVGTHRQGQRQRRDQGQEQGHEQRQGQGQRNAGALQGWMEVSGATAVAGAADSYILYCMRCYCTHDAGHDRGMAHIFMIDRVPELDSQTTQYH